MKPHDFDLQDKSPACSYSGTQQQHLGCIHFLSSPARLPTTSNRSTQWLPEKVSQTFAKTRSCQTYHYPVATTDRTSTFWHWGMLLPSLGVVMSQGALHGVDCLKLIQYMHGQGSVGVTPHMLMVCCVRSCLQSPNRLEKRKRIKPIGVTFNPAPAYAGVEFKT